MDTQMIIDCRAPCVWMRVRDKILHLFSSLLWAMLLLLLFQAETSDMAYFFFSFYIAMILLVSGMLGAWSQYRKTVFRFLTRKQNRRTRYTLLGPAITAKYFRMEENYLCTLQQEKSTVIQHGKDGYVSSIFHDRSMDPFGIFEKDDLPYRAAA